VGFLFGWYNYLIMKNSIFIAIIFMLIVGAFFVVYSALMCHSQVILGGEIFIVDTARTEYTQKKGLSNKNSLPEDGGMLFIFPSENRHGIWMKDMNFPIDILWIDSNMKIVHIEKSVSPNTYPKIFSPTTPSLHVLEISAGKSDLLNLKTGDSVIFFK